VSRLVVTDVAQHGAIVFDAGLALALPGKPA
jgi:hypothetical protein